MNGFYCFFFFGSAVALSVLLLLLLLLLLTCIRDRVCMRRMTVGFVGLFAVCRMSFAKAIAHTEHTL